MVIVAFPGLNKTAREVAYLKWAAYGVFNDFSEAAAQILPPRASGHGICSSFHQTNSSQSPHVAMSPRLPQGKPYRHWGPAPAPVPPRSRRCATASKTTPRRTAAPRCWRPTRAPPLPATCSAPAATSTCSTAATRASGSSWSSARESRPVG